MLYALLVLSSNVVAEGLMNSVLSSIDVTSF